MHFSLSCAHPSLLVSFPFFLFFVVLEPPTEIRHTTQKYSLFARSTSPLGVVCTYLSLLSFCAFHMNGRMLLWCPLSLVSYTLNTQRLEAAKRKQNRATASAGNDSDNNGNGSSDGDHVSDDDDGELDEDELEARKAADYFEDGDGDDASPGGGGTAGDASAGAGGVGVGGVPFQQLNISRPLLRAVEAMGYVTPTPVQQRAVPFALAGRCVVCVYLCMFVLFMPAYASYVVHICRAFRLQSSLSAALPPTAVPGKSIKLGLIECPKVK